VKKILTFILFFLFFTSNVYATPGNLRKDSIITCNGVLYGQHGDGHWHRAQRNANGTYSAIGEPIRSRPCGGTTRTTTRSTTRTTARTTSTARRNTTTTTRPTTTNETTTTNVVTTTTIITSTIPTTNTNTSNENEQNEEILLSPTEEVIATIITVGIFGGIGYGGYKLGKKIKNKIR